MTRLPSFNRGNTVDKVRAIKTVPSDEKKKMLEVLKPSERKNLPTEGRMHVGFNMNDVPDDLVYPILTRFDQTRVHTAVAWNRRFSSVVMRHLSFWRPRVIVMFETTAVRPGIGNSLIIILKLSVIIPTPKSNIPLGGREVQQLLLEEEFMFFTSCNNLGCNPQKLINKKGLQDVREYPLPDFVQEAIKVAFKRRQTHYFCLGLEVSALRLTDMDNLITWFPAHFLSLHVPTISGEELRYKHKELLIDVDHRDIAAMRLRSYVHALFVDWRAGNRKKLDLCIVRNFQPDFEKLVRHDWSNYLCACQKEMLLYGQLMSSLRILQNGLDLFIIHGDIEVKELKMRKWGHLAKAK